MTCFKPDMDCACSKKLLWRGFAWDTCSHKARSHDNSRNNAESKSVYVRQQALLKSGHGSGATGVELVPAG